MFKQFCDFVRYYGKDRKLKIFIFLLISVIAGCLEFVGIGLVYPFLIMIIKSQSLMKINGLKFILATGFLIVAMFVMKNLLMIFCTYLQNKFVIDWKNDINKMLMAFYLNVPYKTLFENSNSEKIYNLTVLSSQTLETFILRSLVFVTNFVIVSLILLLLFVKFFTAALLTTFVTALGMMFLNKFFKRKTEMLAPQMLEFSLKNNNQVIENVKNLKEIRIFSAEKFFQNKFEKIQGENNAVIFKNAFYASIPPYIIELIMVFAIVITAYVITYQNAYDTSKVVASYGLILAAVFRLAPSLNRIQVALNHMHSSKEMVKKMNEEYLKYKFDEIKKYQGNDERIEFKNSLKFENVSFSYGEENPVIKNISFEIKKGEFIGITGLSGAGKTTLADIIMGLLPVDSGKIYVDSVVLNEKNIYAFRRLTGYVPQEMNILEDTFKNNTAWGVESSEIDDERVKECLKQAQLYDTAMQNGGIDSVITGLSQGQKQRLLIARALYFNPEIIILDEATSSLDVKTENEIIELLKNLKGKKTIISITHRLVTLKVCDEIIYMKNGEIAGFAPFEELKETHKDFENLINLSKI